MCASIIPNADAERKILQLARMEAQQKALPHPQKISQEVIFAARNETLALHMAPAVEEYIVQLIIATRQPEKYDKQLAGWIEFGASPRATIALERCARARAWLANRDYVSPDDVQAICADVLRHRLILSFDAEAERCRYRTGDRAPARTGPCCVNADCELTTASIEQTARDLHEQPLRGAYCELHRINRGAFDRERLAACAINSVRAPSCSAASVPTLRGRGLEFEEVRAYQAGDDVRMIDWRVTARSGRPFTKLFREERERPVLLVVDQRQPMFFGSRHCFKSKLAAWLGALLAWSATRTRRSHRRFDYRQYRAPRNSPAPHAQNSNGWLNLLQTFNRRLQRDTQLHSTEQSLLAALADLRRIAKPGSAIYLISDFRGSRTSASARTSVRTRASLRSFGAVYFRSTRARIAAARAVYRHRWQRSA